MTETDHAALVLAIDGHLSALMHVAQEHDPTTGHTVNTVPALLVWRHTRLANHALQEIKGRVPAGFYAKSLAMDRKFFPETAPCAAT